MNEQLSISVSGLMLILLPSEQTGIPRSELCKLIGIKPQVLEEPDDRLPASVVAPILEAAVKQAGDELFWLKATRSANLPVNNLFFYTVFQSGTLREALIRAERFFSYITDLYYPSCHITKDEFSLRFNFRVPVNDVSIYRIDHIFSSFKTFIEMFAGPRLKLKGIRLTVPFLQRSRDYEKHFAVPVTHGQYHNELVFRRADLNLPNAWSAPDPHLDKILLRQIESTVQELKVKVGFIESLHMAVEKQLSTGKPELRKTAAMLTMSSRTLQRRLTEMKTTFNNEVHEVRSKLAAYYLKQSKIPVSQIAFMLGFKDSRSLSVAYQKWFGITPTEYRRQQVL